MSVNVVSLYTTCPMDEAIEDCMEVFTTENKLYAVVLITFAGLFTECTAVVVYTQKMCVVEYTSILGETTCVALYHMTR